jgi:hypothetical protein
VPQQVRVQIWEREVPQQALALGEQIEQLVVLQALTVWVLDCWEPSPCETTCCERVGSERVRWKPGFVQTDGDDESV